MFECKAKSAREGGGGRREEEKLGLQEMGDNQEVRTCNLHKFSQNNFGQ
jgi:hypothetical protein